MPKTCLKSRDEAHPVKRPILRLDRMKSLGKAYELLWTLPNLRKQDSELSRPTYTIRRLQRAT